MQTVHAPKIEAFADGGVYDHVQHLDRRLRIRAADEAEAALEGVGDGDAREEADEVEAARTGGGGPGEPTPEAPVQRGNGDPLLDANEDINGSPPRATRTHEMRELAADEVGLRGAQAGKTHGHAVHVERNGVMHGALTLRRHLGKVLTLVFVTYFVLAPGHVDSIDATASIETATALIEHGTIFVPKKPGMSGIVYHRRADRSIVSKLGLGTPLLYAPSVFVANTLSAKLGYPAATLRQVTVSFVSTLLAFGAVYFLGRATLTLGLDRKRAMLMVLCGAFATLIFPYSKSQTRDVALAFALMGYVALELEGDRRAGWLAAFGLLVKPAFCVPLMPLWLYFRWQEARRGAWRRTAWHSVPLAVATIVTLAYQRYAFGDPLNTGYEAAVTSVNGAAWATPFLDGLWQQLGSPEGGLLFFSPLTAFLIVRFAVLSRRGRRLGLDLALLASFGVSVVFYARWASPLGFGPCGPRFLVPCILPLCLLGAGELDRRWRPAFLVFAALSFAVQATLVLTKPTITQNIRYATPKGPKVPSIVAHFKVLAHKLTRDDELYCFRDYSLRAEVRGGVDLSSFRTLRGFNIWWLHALRPPPKPLAALPDACDHR